MTLKELVREVAKHYATVPPPSGRMTEKYATDIVYFTINAITNGLCADGFVTMGDLGKFTVKIRKARKGRNPRTKAPVDIPASRTAAFRPAKRLKDRLKEYEAARQVAETLLQLVLEKNLEAGRALSSILYTALAGRGSTITYPEEKETVADALLARLGGAFQRFWLGRDPESRKWFTNEIRFQVRLASDSGDRFWILEMVPEDGEWKVGRIL